MSLIKGRTHVSTRPRATPLLKISLAPQGASTHVAKFVSRWKRGRIGLVSGPGCPRVAVVKHGPVQPTSRPFPEFATCVDAPLGAREIFKSGAARGRVLTCVRPLLRRVSCRGPRWESEDQVQFKPTRWKRLSQSWFSRSRLLTVAPSLSFDPPTPRQPRGCDSAYTAATGAR